MRGEVQGVRECSLCSGELLLVKEVKQLILEKVKGQNLNGRHELNSPETDKSPVLGREHKLFRVAEQVGTRTYSFERMGGKPTLIGIERPKEAERVLKLDGNFGPN